MSSCCSAADMGAGSVAPVKRATCRASRAGPSKVAAASGGSKRVHAGPPGVDTAICGKGVKHRAAGAKRPRCGLCLRGGGAMKRTTDGRWAHLNCALYVPECYFHHPEGREPIDISRVPPRRRQMRCTLCRKPGGACVSCAEPGCKEAFHVTCGQEAGAALEFREGKDGAGGVTFAFCPKHAKLWREREAVLQLAERGVPIFGLNYKDDSSKALDWLAQLGDPYRLNIFDADGLVGLDLGVYGAPETYVIDEKGQIVHRHVGVLDARVFARDFQRWFPTGLTTNRLSLGGEER